MSDADQLIRDAFHDIAGVAFDSDSTRDARLTLDRICSVIYSTEQCLDNLQDVLPQQQRKVI